MQTRRSQSLRKASVFQPNSLHIAHNHAQHGFPSLLGVPQESLTHITSYLPPPALLALALTCRRLCDHVDDDNTWLRALLTQSLGISPEHELGSQHTLLLKRTEPTWRKEFTSRHEIRRRWERSRNPTITHIPQDSSIDGAHFMPEQGLLTSSVQYGVVARSIPQNGRVLRGYIDAAGTGLGIGNPNVEFTPDVSACTMSSFGAGARVFWGKRNGEVAITVANRVMETRASCMFIRCRVVDQHEGAVLQLIPDSESHTLVSAGADGRIKLWDVKDLRLLWSTEKHQASLVADPFVCVVGGLGNSFVAGALNSGDILLYDLHGSEAAADGYGVHSTCQLRIPSPVHHEKPQPLTTPLSGDIPGEGSSPKQHIAKMWLYQVGEASVLLFVQYNNYPKLYRVHANVSSHDVTITALGDSTFSNISVVLPVISTVSSDKGMVIVGDLLGYASIYDATSGVSPAHRFEAHTDGAVTAITWSPAVFATGSSRGTTVVWDSLTLGPVRYFATPAPRPVAGDDWEQVSCILLDKELVIIIVGNRVMTWKVAPSNGHEHPRKKSKHANGKLNVVTKGHEQFEMHNEVAESYRELEYERAYTQRLYGREREQRTTLDNLGLSELEVVEYVLMLSRDEEEARQQRAVTEEGVFEGDFDDLPATPTSSRSRSTASLPLSSHSSPTHRMQTRAYPRFSASTSNEKVQVSPPFVPEPMEAGTSISPLRSLALGGAPSDPMEMARSTSSSSLDHFPSLSSSLSSTSSSKRGTSAWCTPLKVGSPVSGPSSPRPRVGAPGMGRTRSSNKSSLLSADVARHGSTSSGGAYDEMDADLRLAIELSLAEVAQRKGDDM